MLTDQHDAILTPRKTLRARGFAVPRTQRLIHCTEPKLRGFVAPCETLLLMALGSLTSTTLFLTRRHEATEAHPLHRTPVLTISIYTSPRVVKLAVKSSFPYQGKVDREAPSTSSGRARRKGSPPSLSAVYCLDSNDRKTPPSRQTEPPPLRSRLRSNRATPSQGGGA